MATHSSILAWSIPLTEEPGEGLQMTKLYFLEPETGRKLDQGANRTEEGPLLGPRLLSVFSHGRRG